VNLLSAFAEELMVKSNALRATKLMAGELVWLAKVAVEPDSCGRCGGFSPQPR
jgi:hypothetical protein